MVVANNMPNTSSIESVLLLRFIPCLYQLRKISVLVVITKHVLPLVINPNRVKNRKMGSTALFTLLIF